MSKDEGTQKARPRDAAKSARKETRTKQRHDANRKLNEQQHEVNLALLTQFRGLPSTTVVTRTRMQYDKKEHRLMRVEYEVTKKLKASKIVRQGKRELAGIHDAEVSG